MLLDLRRYRLLLMGIIAIGLIALPFWLLHQQKPEPITYDEPITPAFYGELVSWDQASQLLARYDRATIIDVDTRLAFRVQRRAGQRHADVQPLTAQDTEIMKTIYQGKWSWQRRAIVVELENGRRLAASMHGMPHGAGAIPGNNFPGHFCVHFLNSTTHASGRADPAHQIMVLKASDRFDQHLQTISAEEAITIFFTAVDQGETALAARFLGNDQNARLLLARTCRVDSVRIDSIVTNGNQGYLVRLRVAYANGQEKSCPSVVINFQNPYPPWIIEAASLMECFNVAGK